MIIRTISKQHTGGVTKKKDQPEWMTDGPSVDHSLRAATGPLAIRLQCADCVLDPTSGGLHLSRWQMPAKGTRAGMLHRRDLAS
jgi:hypothetical protein